jgi:small subunit ribosomal protein S6
LRRILYTTGMKSYQLTYIIASEVPQDTIEMAKKDIETYIQENQGVIVSSDKTTPQMLAYPINKRSSGHFITMEFQVAEANIKALDDKIKKEKNVLRHTIVVKQVHKQKKPPRTRKPMDGMSTPKLGGLNAPKTASETHKVELQDIDKKLNEILGE